jgi:hypothetical protein
MQMNNNPLLVYLDAIQVQRARESKKGNKIDGDASGWLTWISLRAFYHKRRSNVESAGHHVALKLRTPKLSKSPDNFSRGLLQAA